VFREEEALEIGREVLKKHQLEIDLLGVTQDSEQTTFLFSSAERVDLRGVLNDLREILQTEVYFREVGSREKARSVGGLGKCGRMLCCLGWLGKIPPQTLDKLEEEATSLQDSGEVGACGRIRCCTFFEIDKEWVPYEVEPVATGRKDDKPRGEQEAAKKEEAKPKKATTARKRIRRLKQ